MEFLRLFLFLGLVLHKFVWEVLKRYGRGIERQQHSAKKPFKRFIKLLKMFVLVFLAIQTLFLDLFPITEEPTPLKIIGITLYLSGLVTAVIGRLHLGKNWVDLEDYRVLPGQSLVEYGIYRYIRHPIYMGDVLLLLGLELSLNSWLVLGVPILFFIVLRQTSIEEALLSRSLPGYDAYCAKTKRFIPFIL